jgi:trans-aconitate methyltransferase
VQRAKERGIPNTAFRPGNMAAWEGDTGVSLIVAEECLYYLGRADAEAFLRRCCASLAVGGSILVIVHDAQKHAATLDVCRSTCTVAGDVQIGERVYLTLHA